MSVKRCSKSHPRINHLGNVWCFACQRYLRREAFAPAKHFPSWKQPRIWSYCRSCTQARDRERYAVRNATPEGHLLDVQKRYTRKTRQRRTEQRERREFAAFAITQIRKRGLTKSEISRLTGISLSTLIKFERMERTRPDPQPVRRIELLYEAVMDWPKREEPEFRRRLPHPMLRPLELYMARRTARYPIRSRWKSAEVPA